MKAAMHEIKEQRYQNADSYGFNWSLHIASDFQQPFVPTHENMANLDLHLTQTPMELAANLRRAFSGIVAGNIKAETQDLIEEKGKFQLHGDPKLMEKIDRVLQDFVVQHRMKLPGGDAYEPCYEIVK